MGKKHIDSIADYPITIWNTPDDVPFSLTEKFRFDESIDRREVSFIAYVPECDHSQDALTRLSCLGPPQVLVLEKGRLEFYMKKRP